jgi:putative effector of murein hydrolase LrgA (UPF0299 family)
VKFPCLTTAIVVLLGFLREHREVVFLIASRMVLSTILNFGCAGTAVDILSSRKIFLPKRRSGATGGKVIAPEVA